MPPDRTPLTAPQRTLLTAILDHADRISVDFSLDHLPLGSAWPLKQRVTVAYELRDAGLLTMVQPFVRTTEAAWATLRRKRLEPVVVTPPAAPARLTTWDRIDAALRVHPDSTTAEIATGISKDTASPRLISALRENRGLSQDRTRTPMTWRIGAGVDAPVEPEAEPSEQPEPHTEAPCTPTAPGPEQMPPPSHPTADRARDVLWEALQPEGDRDGLTVLGLAEMAVERLAALSNAEAEKAGFMDLIAEAHQILGDAGAPKLRLGDRIRWLHGEVAAALNLVAWRDSSVRAALGVSADVAWTDVLALARQRSRPLADQLDEVARQSEVRAAILSAACGELRGAA